MSKLKVSWKPNLLDEAKTIGYMEGYSDGRNEILEDFQRFGLLKKNWKRDYNKQCRIHYKAGNYDIK